MHEKKITWVGFENPLKFPLFMEEEKGPLEFKLSGPRITWKPFVKGNKRCGIKTSLNKNYIKSENNI